MMMAKLSVHAVLSQCWSRGPVVRSRSVLMPYKKSSTEKPTDRVGNPPEEKKAHAVSINSQHYVVKQLECRLGLWGQWACAGRSNQYSDNSKGCQKHAPLLREDSCSLNSVVI